MPVMKFTSILVLSIISTFALCLKYEKDYSAEIEGYWYAESNNSGGQKYVLYISQKDGKLYAETHSYQDEIKFESVSTNDVEFENPNLNILMNPESGIRFKATLNSTDKKLLGSIEYSSGASVEMNLDKLDSETVERKFPGLTRISKNSYSYEQPESGDNLESGSLAESELDEKPIEEFVNKIYSGDVGAIHSLLIIKDNKLVFEEYFDGYCKSDLHFLQSCTKSFGSMLIGLAMDKGFIKNLDTPVFDFFPQYENLKTSNWGKVTIKNILNMNAGVDWSDGYDLRIFDESKNVIRDVLSRELLYTPGEKFEYRNPNVDLISGIIKESTGMHADVFAEKYLFEPLGIDSYNWSMRKQNGYPMIDGSLALSSRSLAKVGMMMLNEGKFNGTQILSPEWVKDSFTRHMAVDNIFDYGHLWWIGKSLSVPGTDLYIANGKGSEFIIVAPSLNMVVVTTGANYDMRVHMKSLQLIDQYIIKSVSIN